MYKTLHEYQFRGTAFLAGRARALLADEPGLGKTLQAIAAAEAVKAKRILVVCPASVRLNWAQEIHECLGHFDAGRWRIVSYNSAVKLARTPGPDDFDLCILDEAHFLKTRDSQRTQAVLGNKKGIARHARRIWALTGTPVLNRPVELYPLLKVLAVECIRPFDTYSAFANRWCGAFWDGYGLNVRGASHIDDLAQRLKPFMLRRTKVEVLSELPEKIITRVPVDAALADLEAVTRAEEEISGREALLSAAAERFSQLGDMSTLLRLTGEAKVPAAVQFVDDLLESEPKVVVFARHRNVIAQLQRDLSNRGYGCAVYQGGMSDTDKSRALTLFEKDPNYRVFIGNIQAAGTGINGLQRAASAVVFAELSWTPGEMSQAIDRVHRIGQERSAVNVHLLHIPGTLESAILGVHNAKNSVIERLMETRSSVTRAAADFKDLI